MTTLGNGYKRAEGGAKKNHSGTLHALQNWGVTIRNKPDRFARRQEERTENRRNENMEALYQRIVPKQTPASLKGS